jgi:hypothetical protein
MPGYSDGEKYAQNQPGNCARVSVNAKGFASALASSWLSALEG